MICASCSKTVVTTKGAAFEVIGWELKRDQGGTNHILWPERTERVMCSTCVQERKHGINKNQLTLA